MQSIVRSLVQSYLSRWGAFWPACCVCSPVRLARRMMDFWCHVALFTQCQWVSTQFTAKCFMGTILCAWPLQASISHIPWLALNQWHVVHVPVHIANCFIAFIHAALTLNCGLLNYEAGASFLSVFKGVVYRKIVNHSPFSNLCHYKPVWLSVIRERHIEFF